MKVLLVNGSPHKQGCTYTALNEVAKSLNENDIDTKIFWIGNKPIGGCIACKSCVTKGKCIFNDIVNEFLDIAINYDGFILVLLYIGELWQVIWLLLWIEFFMQIFVVISKVFC